MNAKHEFHLKCRCPVDDSEDVYWTTVTTAQTIETEHMMMIANDLAKSPKYQETLTQQLADNLQAHVVTVGKHGDVTTTCEASW